MELLELLNLYDRCLAGEFGGPIESEEEMEKRNELVEKIQPILKKSEEEISRLVYSENPEPESLMLYVGLFNLSFYVTSRLHWASLTSNQTDIRRFTEGYLSDYFNPRAIKSFLNGRIPEPEQTVTL